jgi:hypothetical protein
MDFARRMQAYSLGLGSPGKTGPCQLAGTPVAKAAQENA